MNTEEGGKIKFHYGFYGAIKVIYEAFRASYSFLQEQQLGDEPVRLDMLAVRKDEKSVLDDPIGRFFKKHNILDYKSPDDALSINDFYKAQGYACIYKSVGRVNEIRGEDLTVSIFRHTYPREMFSMLTEEGRGTISPYPGIYHVTGPLMVPAQVVVMSQLPDGEYEALKVLTRGAKETDVVKFLEDNKDNQEAADDISAILRVSIAANEELFQKLREAGIMVGAVERLFQKEFDAARDEGIIIGEARSNERVRQEERRGIRDMLIAGGMRPQDLRDRLVAGGMAPQEAANLIGLSV